LRLIQKAILALGLLDKTYRIKRATANEKKWTGDNKCHHVRAHAHEHTLIHVHTQTTWDDIPLGYHSQIQTKAP
jgi:hypothetical protein